MTDFPLVKMSKEDIIILLQKTLVWARAIATRDIEGFKKEHKNIMDFTAELEKKYSE